MCPGINRYVNYVPIAKVIDWGKDDEAHRAMNDELENKKEAGRVLRSEGVETNPRCY